MNPTDKLTKALSFLAGIEGVTALLAKIPVVNMGTSGNIIGVALVAEEGITGLLALLQAKNAATAPAEAPVTAYVEAPVTAYVPKPVTILAPKHVPGQAVNS